MLNIFSPRFILDLFLSAAAVKLLLATAYHSTDFEVHRNWMAITHNVDWHMWYTQPTPSIWTLDYPPLFAMFEYCLSFVAALLDPEMLRVDNLDYASAATVWFQRGSVAILGDAVFLYALVRYWRSCPLEQMEEKGISSIGGTGSVRALFLIVTFLQPALFIVDQIHFQYNGMMYGIFVLSVCFMQEGRYLTGAATYTVLLLFKHIYLYMAPAYFVFLLKHFVFAPHRTSWTESTAALIATGVTVLSIAAAVVGPFILKGRLFDLLGRMFPWERGLCHAYWAPNAYVPYNIVDRVLCKKLGIVADCDAHGVSSKGLLRRPTHSHVHLPNITPLVTNVLVVLSLLGPMLAICCSGGSSSSKKRARQHHPSLELLQLCVLSCTSFFMFGWHVHEKAILMILVPLGLLLGRGKMYTSLFMSMTVCGSVAVIPLIYTPLEQPVLHALVWGLIILFWLILRPQLSHLDLVMVVAYFAASCFASVADTSASFLPLLLCSLVCCVGVFRFWAQFCGVVSGNKEYPIAFAVTCVFLATCATFTTELKRVMTTSSKASRG
eukprot:PhM_4_TR68/c0_g1_i1/m.94456/K03849/ALG8; alpha-1,3-glucosyltransferase